MALTAVVSDTFAAASAMLCRILANVLTGHVPDRGWLYMPDLSTVLDVTLVVLMTMALQRYIVGLLRNVRRTSMRHHLAASCVRGRRGASRAPVTFTRGASSTDRVPRASPKVRASSALGKLA